jgi:enoyl-CoA hydratase/carnithine racemase
MSAPTVQVESRGAVTVVTLNRPDLSNTLNIQMAMDLLAAAMTCGRYEGRRRRCVRARAHDVSA